MEHLFAEPFLFFFSLFLFLSLFFFLFWSSFVSFSLSFFACRAWPHTYPFIVLFQIHFILLFLCHLIRQKFWWSENQSVGVCNIRPTPQDERHLDFLFFILLSELEFGENALLLLHRRAIDTGAFDISNQMKIYYIFIIQQTFFS